MKKLAIRYFYKTFFLFALLFGVSPAFCQLPQDLPYDTGPLTLDNPVKVLVYVVLPVLAIIIVIIYKMRKRSKEKRDRDGL